MSVPRGLAPYAFRAMGTSVTVLLPEDDRLERGRRVQGLFAQWEARLSRFLPNSELSLLNLAAGHRKRVSDLLARVLATALQAARETDGLFDPTMAVQIGEIGYDRSWEQVERQSAQAPPAARRPGGGWRQIEVDEGSRTVFLPRHLALDFGGLAKGMAVDAAIELLRDRGTPTALVNAGGDLRVLGAPPDGWTILVEGAERSVVLRSGAMATSGTSGRSWLRGGQPMHHLLDPRTGRPAQGGVERVTVVAETCAQADVAAKVALILGPEQGPTLLEHLGLAGLLQLADGGQRTTARWPQAAG